MDDFIQTHKLYEEDATRTVTGTDASVPSELIRLMQQVNSNSYAEGFFKFIAPDACRHYFTLWKLDPAECFPFIKCAFGHLIFYHQQQYKVLNPVHNAVDILGEKNELDFVMDIALTDREVLENSFFLDVYEQASERLKGQALDEIYAFVPALGLGGSRDPQNVHRKKMEQEMLILAQI